MSKFTRMQNCFHCGLDIINKKDVSPDKYRDVLATQIIFDDKLFCCNGCKTVYEIFSLNDMTCYYDFEKSPGATPLDIKGKYDYLDNDH